VRLRVSVRVTLAKAVTLVKPKAERVAMDLPAEVDEPGTQDRTAYRAQRLPQHVEHLENARSLDAATQLPRALLQHPVQLDDKAIEVLDNREMRTAMSTAERVASARHDDPEAANQVKDIQRLREYFHAKDRIHRKARPMGRDQRTGPDARTGSDAP